MLKLPKYLKGFVTLSNGNGNKWKCSVARNWRRKHELAMQCSEIKTRQKIPSHFSNENKMYKIEL